MAKIKDMIRAYVQLEARKLEMCKILHLEVSRAKARKRKSIYSTQSFWLIERHSLHRPIYSFY